MALGDFINFKEPMKCFDVNHAVHAPIALQHNEELSIPVEPVLKVFVKFTEMYF